ncbi:MULTISPECIES: glycosyltransferase [Fischerella]|nr:MULTISPECIES: glycosyltransferase [Fischerella]MBD2432469.1 glycosyltransferase [Fischerella sp. FACHB-380]
MLSDQVFIPSIFPIYEGTKRPFWSVMIPTYNCANYLIETLKSVLAQDPGPDQMQIEVVDDYSTKDDPEAIVREIGKGRVSFFRQPQNMGPIPNFNTCIQRAKGHWVHILHGDDMVLPGFYSRLRKSLEKEPTVGAAFCRHIFVDENGEWQWLSVLERETAGIIYNWIERLAISQRIETPSIVVRRSVYEKLGGFHLELFHTADWEMWKRIAVHYPVWFETQPLAYYRRHSASHTSTLIRSGANIANALRAIEISESYLPKAFATQLSNQARKNYAFVAISTARRMLAMSDMEAAIAQIWSGLNCSDSPEVISSLISLLKSIDSEKFLVELSNYAEQKQGNETSQSALTKLYQALEEEPSDLKTTSPTIVFDGVAFQILEKAGITRVWTNLLEEWIKNGFAKYIILLDRAGTAPHLSGIRYINFPAYGYGNTEGDREMLQQICDQFGADLFISSYYTTPISTPSVFLAHDMIPEAIGWNLNLSVWRNKHHSIRHAAIHIAVSENTAQDLVKFFPHISLESVIVAKNGVDAQIFSPASSEDISSFKKKYGIIKPYFMLVGIDDNRKNRILFFKAFSQLSNREGFEIVCTGSDSLLNPELRNYTSGSVVHILELEDEELATAYSGAVALVYPSKYEGFGLPILEAMACGCPVITCPNGSIPEVAGEAAIYVNHENADELADALGEVQKPSIRKSVIAAGLKRVKQFSWSQMANTVSSALIDATLLPLKLKDNNLIIFPDWLQPEEKIGWELQAVIKAIATHSENRSITLLVTTSNISYDDAELFLSSVTMNLLMEEDLDLSQGPEISLVSELGEIQWQALLSHIQARIILSYEDKDVIAQIRAENLTSYNLEFSL